MHNRQYDKPHIAQSTLILTQWSSLFKTSVAMMPSRFRHCWVTWFKMFYKNYIAPLAGYSQNTTLELYTFCELRNVNKAFLAIQFSG